MDLYYVYIINLYMPDLSNYEYIIIHLVIYPSNSNVDNLGCMHIILCSYIYTIKPIFI